METMEEVLEKFLSGIACCDPDCNNEHIVLFLEDEMIPILKELNKRHGIINKPIAEAKE